jgi:amino acid permease
LSSDTDPPIFWRDIWIAIISKDATIRQRALRETFIILFASLAPLFLGAFFAYVGEQKTKNNHHAFLALLVLSTLKGQLFLLFISLAGTIFARLWDSQGPKFHFSGWMNLFQLLGWMIACGLLALDPSSSSFEFWPVGALSVFFFLAVIVNYFVTAVPNYIPKPDLQGSSNRRSSKMSDDLQRRMGK